MDKRLSATLLADPAFLWASARGLPKKWDWGESPFDRQVRVAGFDQRRVAESFIWLFGVNGLGRTLAEFLVRKGYGRIGLADDDDVELTNLHRTLWQPEAVGRPKVVQALRELCDIAPARTEILSFVGRLEDIVSSSDLMDGVSACLVGIDNDRGRAVATGALHRRGIPAVFYSLSPDTHTHEVFVQEKDGPCWACLYPERYRKGLRELTPEVCPKVPSIVDSCLIAVGLASFALDSLLMKRPRFWNLRRGHLHAELPDCAQVFEKDPDCPVCGRKDGP